MVSVKQEYLGHGNSLDIHWYSVRDNYNDNLEYKNNKILEFEIV